MSRREDVIFCQIAITNGIVTEEQAKKALSLCDKREVEQGVRPMVGGVFAKHNLIPAQDVKRIYKAVEKRLGPSVGAEAPAARRGARRRPGQGRGDSRGHSAPKAARQEIDQNTLVMGIGGSVAFLAILGVIIYLVFIKEGREEKEFRDARLVRGTDPAAKGAPPVESTTAPKATPKAEPKPAPEATPAPKAEPTPAPAPKVEPPPVRRAMTRQSLQQVQQLMADTRRGDDPDQRALIALYKIKKDNEDSGIENPPELLEFFKEYPSVPAPEGGGSGEESPSSGSGGAAPSGEPPQADSSEESKEEIQ